MTPLLKINTRYSYNIGIACIQQQIQKFSKEISFFIPKVVSISQSCQPASKAKVAKDISEIQGVFCTQKVHPVTYCFSILFYSVAVQIYHIPRMHFKQWNTCTCTYYITDLIVVHPLKSSNNQSCTDFMSTLQYQLSKILQIRVNINYKASLQ